MRFLGLDSTRPQVVDALLAALMLAIALSVAFGAGAAEPSVDDPVTTFRPTHWYQWVFVAVPSLALAFRRSFPVPAALVGCLATAAVWASELPDFTLAASILIYSVTLHGREPIGRRVGFGLVAALSSFTLIGVVGGEAPIYVLPLVTLMTVASMAFAIGVQNRRAYVREVEERALVAEMHRAASDEALLHQERNRIARELHDVVAHGLGVIVVQAGAGRRILDGDPEGARRALQQIEDTGRNALTEMRQVLGVVRTEPSERLRPTPGLSALDELVDDYRSSGLDVRVLTTGESVPLATTVDTSAYRIIQEALTNSMRHGGPSIEVFVEIVHGEEWLDLRVLDNGRGGSAPHTGGHGLRGMRERVEIFGGTLRTGPRPGGGFEVVARLPHTSVAA